MHDTLDKDTERRTAQSDVDKTTPMVYNHTYYISGTIPGNKNSIHNKGQQQSLPMKVKTESGTYGYMYLKLYYSYVKGEGAQDQQEKLTATILQYCCC